MFAVIALAEEYGDARRRAQLAGITVILGIGRDHHIKGARPKPFGERRVAAGDAIKAIAGFDCVTRAEA